MSRGTLRLKRIKFAAGATPTSPPLDISPSSVVILIGPNNSGKSMALWEIDDWCSYRDVKFQVVSQLEIDWPKELEEALELLKIHEQPPGPGDPNPTVPPSIYVGKPSFDRQRSRNRTSIPIPSLEAAVRQQHPDNLRSYLSALYTVRLDARGRFALVDPMPTGDLFQPAQNLLWALFQNNEARHRVQKLTMEAFGLNYIIDPTAMERFRVRMSSEEIPTGKEQDLGIETREFLKRAPLITDLGDGVQAFTGLVSAILCLPHRIMLVDEPEAFLHPTLARRLGSILANLAREREASLVVATHSSDFLMGCIETNSDTSVVRLEYEAGVASARALSASELSGIARKPLLRSANVLRALFHRAAIVTEGDSDRAFYDEMNIRLLATGRGVRDALFLNAQNKQSIHLIVGPLRRLGVPIAVIVDLDIIEEDSKPAWDCLLEACEIPATQRSLLEVERRYLASVFAAAPIPSRGKAKRLIKSRGLDGLSQPDRDRAQELLDQLGCFGIFLVPKGELEQWLGHIVVNGSKSDWLVNLFSKIGSAESEPSYLRPSTNDVWEFLDNIESWVQGLMTGRISTTGPDADQDLSSSELNVSSQTGNDE